VDNTEQGGRDTHTRVLQANGGAQGLRDENALEFALARPQHWHAYDESAELPQLAAALGVGIARNQAYVDGNKRTALMAMFVFLYQNGLHLVADEKDAVRALQASDSGDATEDDFARWIAANCRPHTLPSGGPGRWQGGD
jgi:death-on-curing protein